MRGLSLADVNDNHKKELLYFSDRLFASGFQFSTIILPIIGVILAILSKIFDYLNIPKNPVTVVVIILIPVITAVSVWGYYFWKNNVVYVALQTPTQRVRRKWLWNNFTNITVSGWVVTWTLIMIYFYLK